MCRSEARSSPDSTARPGRQGCVGNVVLGGVQGAVEDVVDEWVIDGDVELLGDAHDGVQGRPGDLAGLVAADVLEVDADRVAELGLRPASFLVQLRDAVAEGCRGGS